MRHNMGIANEKGLTLVEILAALVILGIVFVGFMTIFPQMTSFNEKTGDKLEAMNLAKMKLEDLQYNVVPAECKGIINLCKIKDETVDDFQVYITYKPRPDLVSGPAVDGKDSLYQVHIEFFRNDQSLDSPPISETFGYVHD